MITKPSTGSVPQSLQIKERGLNLFKEIYVVSTRLAWLWFKKKLQYNFGWRQSARKEEVDETQLLR